MSVRATERLIGSIVTVTGLPKSPQMVVTSIDADKKMVITSWFSSSNDYQEGCFPAGALDRVEKEKKLSPKPKAQSKTKQPVKSNKPKTKKK